ncbi:MAG: thioredoxin [Mycoplasmataceae bacterium]|nr:thioredoxin [Mycoplasmataceae bacterium]
MIKHNLTEKELSDVIQTGGVVLVDFFAEWCGPCKMLAPVIEELAKEHTNVVFVKLDVDKNNDLASKFHVSSIPSIFVFKDKKLANSFVGFKPKEEINKLLK